VIAVLLAYDVSASGAAVGVGSFAAFLLITLPLTARRQQSESAANRLMNAEEVEKIRIAAHHEVDAVRTELLTTTRDLGLAQLELATQTTGSAQRILSLERDVRRARDDAERYELRWDACQERERDLLSRVSRLEAAHDATARSVARVEDVQTAVITKALAAGDGPPTGPVSVVTVDGGE
jgi:chromosome segregation ATPase